MPQKTETAKSRAAKLKTSAPKSAGGRTPKYDWSAIRRAYIRGDGTCTLETLSILGLDQLIGAPKLTGGGQKAGPSAGSYSNTTTVIPSGEKRTSPPVDPLPYVPRSQWREQKSSAVLTLQKLVTTKKGMAFLMSNGATVNSLDLSLKCERV